MASTAVLQIKILADATAAAAGLNKAEQSSSKFARGIQKATKPAAAVGAALLLVGKKAVDAASRLEQSEGAVSAVFGKQAKAVQRYAKSAATSMGLSESAYMQYAALVGTALQNAGFSAKQAVEESNKVMQRAADLSALYGGTTADAVDAINAAVSRSEFDPLEKYGVSLNMTAVNAELAARGQDKLSGSALNTAKKQLILEQIYKQSAKAAGQYARESDSAAGTAQTAAAQWENASAALGKGLLPVVSAATKALGGLGRWMQKNTTTVQVLAGVMGALAAAVLVINGAMKTYAAISAVVTAVQKAATAASLGTRVGLIALAAAQKVAAAAQWLLNAAMSANPVMLVVIAVAALVAGFILLWNKCAGFRSFVLTMWAGIRAATVAVWNAIKVSGAAVFNALKAAVRAVGSVFRSVFSAVRGVASGVWSALTVQVRAWAAAGRAAFNAIRTVASAVWRVVSSGVRTVSSAVRSAFSAMRSVVSSVASGIRSAFSATWGALRSGASGIGKALSAPFSAVKSAVDKVIGAVQSLINWIKKIRIPKINLPKLPGLRKLGRAAPVASPTTRAALSTTQTMRATRATTTPFGLGGGSGITPVVIQVNGALDPEGVARQIKRILGGHEVRVGKVGLRTT